MDNKIEIRKILPADNFSMATIIRNSLTEFKANKQGTVFYDNTTDDLYSLFKKDRSIYFIVLVNNKITGGAGIFPTDNLPEKTVELVKMYLKNDERRKGIGRMLMDKCLDAAKEMGYQTVYIETMPELILAISMYKKYGFILLDKPMGNSGHIGCSIWMKKEL